MVTEFFDTLLVMQFRTFKRANIIHNNHVTLTDTLANNHVTQLDSDVFNTTVLKFVCLYKLQILNLTSLVLAVLALYSGTFSLRNYGNAGR